jgi:hypothetical protein
VPADLDQRLRDALGGPGETLDTGAALTSVLARLPRYRSRRRAGGIAVASGVLVLAAGLGAGIGVGVAGGPPAPVTTSAAPGPVAPDCVAVQVGGRPAACIEESPGPLNAEVAGPALAARSALPEGSPSLRAVAGSPVTVLLPHLAGRSWVTVSFEPSGAAPLSRLLPHRLAGGGAVEVVAHAEPGVFVLRADAVVSCAVAGCSPPTGAGVSQWSVDLLVAPR